MHRVLRRVKRPSLVKLCPIARPERCYPGRHFTAHPDPDRSHFTVEVHISRNSRRMREATVYAGFRRLAGEDNLTAGRVIDRTHNSQRPLYSGRVVAHMFLNVDDLRQRSGEIIAHESGHAAMAWARYRKADLRKRGNNMRWDERKKEGEELFCYALGELARQVAHFCYAHGVFKGML